MWCCPTSKNTTLGRCCVSRCCGLFKHLCGCPKVESLTLLAIRILLFFPLFEAGYNKYMNFDATADWFGNADYGLGLPFPVLMAALATGAELVGAVLLLVGLFTRLFALPLVVVMLVAIFSVHIDNGWLAISAGDSLWFGHMDGAAKLVELKQAIEAAGNSNPALMSAYEATTDQGPLVVLNNGIEFAVTYLLFLMVLVSRGAGLISLDGVMRRCGKGVCSMGACNSGCGECRCGASCSMTAPVAKATVVAPVVVAKPAAQKTAKKAVAKKPVVQKAVAKPVAKKAAPVKKKAAQKTAKKRR